MVDPGVYGGQVLALSRASLSFVMALLSWKVESARLYVCAYRVLLLPHGLNPSAPFEPARRPPLRKILIPGIIYSLEKV